MFKHKFLHSQQEVAQQEEGESHWFLITLIVLVSVGALALLIYGYFKYRQRQVYFEYSTNPESGIPKQSIGLRQRGKFMQWKINHGKEANPTVKQQTKSNHYGSYIELKFNCKQSEINSIISAKPISKEHTQYFEIEVEDNPRNSDIVIGFCSDKEFNNQFSLGRSLTSVGFHSNGGQVFAQNKLCFDYKFTAVYGETLGVGIRQNDGRVWLSYNGKFLNPPAPSEVKKKDEEEKKDEDEEEDEQDNILQLRVEQNVKRIGGIKIIVEGDDIEQGGFVRSCQCEWALQGESQCGGDGVQNELEGNSSWVVMIQNNILILNLKMAHFSRDSQRKKLSQIEGMKCLTQTRSPKHNDTLIRQITSLMKSSRERNHFKNKQHQQSISSRIDHQQRDTSLTFHQLLKDYNKVKFKQQDNNKENSLNHINKTRQISFPNPQLNHESNVLYQINNLTKAQQEDNINLKGIYKKNLVFQKTILDCTHDIQSKLQVLCRNSQEYMEKLIEIREELQTSEQKEFIHKINQRCVSADVQKFAKSPLKKSRSSSQDRKESRYYGSTQANTNPLDLTCDERVTVIQQQEERVKTEPDPYIQLERQYIVDPFYLVKQESITWLMRAILVDWMMEVCMQFQLKRQTFHLAVHYLDCYLSKKGITKQNLQLVGLSSLLIACKIEEIIPKRVCDFERAADNGYTQDQILTMELDILLSLKWKVNPPTYSHWVNWFTDQWDIYADQKYQSLNCYFRKPNEESYQLFRKLVQLIDCSLMEITTLQYIPRTIVIAFMYLVLAFELQIFSLDMIDVIQSGSLFLLDQTNSLNQIFGGFVKTSMGCALTDMLPAIQYSVEYMELDINYDTPPGIIQLNNNMNEIPYEEFLSFQCHSKASLHFVKNRSRE